MEPQKTKQFIRVIDLRTWEVVHCVDVTGKSDRQIDTIERGMLRNMDHDNFFIELASK